MKIIKRSIGEDMKPGYCQYCEDPLPEGRLEGFCDEVCQDLQARSVTGEQIKPSKALRNSWAPMLNHDDLDLLKKNRDSRESEH